MFVQQILVREGIFAKMASGVPDQTGSLPFGFFAGGRWRSHAWLRTESLIIDVTADQFGAEDVIISTMEDARYSEGLTTERTLKITAKHAAAVAALWQSWCLSRK